MLNRDSELFVADCGRAVAGQWPVTAGTGGVRGTEGARVKRPTITDIAQRAGVTKAAVSFALNGQPGVSAATRERILAIAEEIGFQPNSAAVPSRPKYVRKNPSGMASSEIRERRRVVHNQGGVSEHQSEHNQNSCRRSP